MSSGSSVAGAEVGVGHAHHRAGGGSSGAGRCRTTARPSPAGPQPVPHVVGEHAVLDEHVALGRAALVVDGDGSPTRRDMVPSSTSGDERDWPPARRPAPRTPRRPWPRGRPRGRGRTPRGTGRRRRREAMTTGRVPQGAGRAASLREGPAGRRPGQLLHVVAVEQLEADRAADRLPPGLQAGVARRPRTSTENRRAHLVVAGEEAVAVGDQDAPPGVGVAGRPARCSPRWRAPSRRAERAASSARRSSATLRPWRRSRGSDLDRRAGGGAGAVAAGRATVVGCRPPPARAGPRPAACGRPAQARLGRGRRCGRSRWSRPRRPGCRRPGRARSAAPRPGRRRARRRSSDVLGEHLGEVAAAAQGGVERPADDSRRHGHPATRTAYRTGRLGAAEAPPTAGEAAPEAASRCVAARGARLMVPTVPTEPGLRAEVELVVTRRRHRRRRPLGRRARAGHAPPAGAVRGGLACAPSQGQLDDGQDHRRHAGPARPPRPHGRGRRRCGPRPCSRRSRGRG